MRRKYYLSIIIVFFVLFIIIGSFSYAYFTASISGNLANQNVITTGNMSLLFNDGPDVSTSNLVPGSGITKTISVNNNGTVDKNYAENFT